MSFDFLAEHRIIADMAYLSQPRPLEEYVALAERGARWMNLMQVDAGASMSTETGLLPEEFVGRVLRILRPTVEALRAEGLLSRAYVYGFDEHGVEWNASIRQLFGAIKYEWPDLRTVAVLNWPSMPPDMPLDVWIDGYNNYSPEKEKARQAWTAEGKLYFWYWCGYPNYWPWLQTLVEDPAIDARLLFWLTALHKIPGLLYYALNKWADQCPDDRPCKPVTRLNNTARTDFNPATWPSGSPRANGEGNFLYPGAEGLLSSIRFENLRDGIEDWSLFHLLDAAGGSSSKFIQQVIVSGKEHYADASRLELVRRLTAQEIVDRRSSGINARPKWKELHVQV
eukprot:TRINITY_DN3501_c0_g1_i1.p1 TRINITY_DN3501_c0_g1~~TRINITY_DN3501_c0_g1_i1.p1  ORF type:complete len:340 (+),score=43.13 TRINITY_DN3501_c0_g1_i1:152-1171(+)